MDTEHIPVLQVAAIDALAIQPNAYYIDATFGRGGHSALILERLNQDGRLLVIDKDPEAIAVAKALNDSRIIIEHGTFADLDRYVDSLNWKGKVAGILMDLGVSSPQLDTAERGFSFRLDGPLDMRMNPEAGLSAKDWLASVETSDLADVIWRLGEERHARRIARAIVAEREKNPIETTKQLADLVGKIVRPKPNQRIHVATKTFQAIRIFINNELTDLEIALKHAIQVLAPQGRLVVMSFHSLEDRIVKRFMVDLARGEQMPRDLPIKNVDIKYPIKIIKLNLKATEDEIDDNPRARSVRLRVAEKLECV
jgi:16S rRNA (cytosine1402-N4)-methyltransferase